MWRRVKWLSGGVTQEIWPELWPNVLSVNPKIYSCLPFTNTRMRHMREGPYMNEYKEQVSKEERWAKRSVTRSVTTSDKRKLKLRKVPNTSRGVTQFKKGSELDAWTPDTTNWQTDSNRLTQQRQHNSAHASGKIRTPNTTHWLTDWLTQQSRECDSLHT